MDQGICLVIGDDMNEINIQDKAGQEFMDLYLEICRKKDRSEREWISQLKGIGIKATHPDDGWVNREQNYVKFCYPYFKYADLAVGDLAVLGNFEQFRLVRITKIKDSIFLKNSLKYYYFEELEIGACSVAEDFEIEKGDWYERIQSLLDT